MRKTLWVLGICVLSLPSLFVVWLLAAAHWPKMDATTLGMPMSVRSSVAEIVLQKAGWGKTGLPSLARVIRLDPQNAQAWSRSCTWSAPAPDERVNLQACKTALDLEDSAANWNGLGRVQERMGDSCAAEESFTKASGKGSRGTAYTYVENMGRAALRCGQYYDARAGLEAAIDLEGRSAKDTDNWDDDEIADFKKDQMTDREYLIVALNRLHQNDLAKEACSAAHPDWAGCACDLDKKGDVSCAEAKH